MALINIRMKFPKHFKSQDGKYGVVKESKNDDVLMSAIFDNQIKKSKMENDEYDIVGEGVIKWKSKEIAEKELKDTPLQYGYSTSWVGDNYTEITLGEKLPSGWYSSKSGKNGNRLPFIPLTEDILKEYKKDSMEENKTSKKLQLSDIPESVKAFMPLMQQRAIVGSEEHWSIIKNLENIIANMPKSYETENTETSKKVVYLHYFYGSSDWYIVEKDMEDEQLQAFGYSILNGDTQNAEWGYINIEELKSTNKVKLDFYFEPIEFGKLFSEDEEELSEHEKSLQNNPTNHFVYGKKWGVPTEYGKTLIESLESFGFEISDMGSQSFYISRPNQIKIGINDNGGEFNIYEQNGNHITNIPYDKTTGIENPYNLATEIENVYLEQADKKEEPSIAPETETTTETQIVESIIETEKTKAPLEEVVIQNAEIKDLSYQPQSESCNTVATIVPYSMRYDMHKAIETIDRRVNGVDEYVAEKLGYIIGDCDVTQRKEGLRCLCDAFSAEQVDAIAVAIYNIEERGQGCIIGDQTGIGKGRIAAGIIRYAIMKGLKPIFITEKPTLFSDFFRDLINIGSDDAIPLQVLKGYKEVERKIVKESDAEDTEEVEEGFEEDNQIVKIAVYETNKFYEKDIKGKRRAVPFILNGAGSKTTVKDEQGNILYKGLPKNENLNIIKHNKVPKEFNFVLATYSQFRGRTDSEKMQFLLNIANGNIVVLDEVHNASGASNTGAFFIKALEKTLGVTFLSATFAKRPDNMPIYATKTAMSDANMTSEALVGAITSGGVALQEIVSSNLVAEGQMIRRERSFEGIEVNYEYLDITQNSRLGANFDLEVKHRAIMDNATEIIRAIMDFQRDFVNPQIKEMDKIAKAEYHQVEKRKGTANAGVDNPPIFSGVFNVINQLLFAIKAESVADVAIQRLKEGKKPIIAFANTMESFLNTLTNDDGFAVREGDIINADFSKIFEKRLNSVLRYTEKDENGISTYEMLDVSAMPEDFQFEYNRILQKIKTISLGISSSPIDVLIDKIEKAGFSVAEVTGRDKQLKMLPNFKAQIKSKVKIGANDAFREFNNNEVDCLLINQSGSTGASAHAIVTKKITKENVKQRVMIILQAELNINTEVQKRGRINRTGQILKPIYDYVISAIPAEKRLMMMLQKKLKSLDANTTSSQKQSADLMDVRQVDFLNKYGDQIVVEYLKENPLINLQIGDPLKMANLAEGEMPETAEAAHRVSGRVAILSVKDQENFYSEVSQRYISAIEYLIQSGEYDLEVESMNLQAETIEKDVVVVGKGGESVFGRNSILEKVTVNNLKKPYTKIELNNLLIESLGDYNAESLKRAILEKYERFVTNQLAEEIAEQNEHYDNLIENISKEKQATKANNLSDYIRDRKEDLEEAREDMIKRIKTATANKKEYILRIMQFFHVGKVVGYPSVNYGNDSQYYKAIFLGFVINDNLKNPYAPSAIKLRFALAGSQRYIAVPASKFDIVTAIRAITYENIFSDEQRYTLDNWDEIIAEKSSDKTIRYIVTGNILQAFGKQELKGALISYTTSTGGLKKGILLPDGFTTKPTRDKPAMRITVPIIKALPIYQSMTVGSSLKTNDSFSLIRQYDSYKIIVPINKKIGGKFYLDNLILKLTNEGTFNKSGSDMVATMELRKIDNLIQYLQDTFNSSVDLVTNQFERIKDSIMIEDYADEEKQPQAEVYIQKLTELDIEEENKRKQEEEQRLFDEEQQKIADQLAKEEAEKAEGEEFHLAKRKLAIKKKLMNVLRLLYGQELLMAKGGVLKDENLEKLKLEAYTIGINACKNDQPRVVAQNQEMMDFLSKKGDSHVGGNSVELMKAFENGYYNENEKTLRARFPEMYKSR